MALTSDSFGETDNSDSAGNGSISTNGNHRLNIRVVTLNKANVMFGGSLGFSIRGGREHTTGVFISNVEPRSEAERSGLKVGDQIIRINGFPIEDATHTEVLQLIHSQNTIMLKVRSVGMIPTKERDKSVSWKLVETDNNVKGGGSNQNERNIVQITMEVPLHGRLGCGICKGPVWKPGIFVQFTKDNCIAKDSGLKRGDQILECNGVKFTPDVSFESAVSVMKSSGLLELVVQKNAGLDLFPGGSSGYNSSTSSLNGDNPDEPALLQFKRLSVVKEESLGNGRCNSLEDVNRNEMRTNQNSATTVSLSSAISEEIRRRSERTSVVSGKDFVKTVEAKKLEDDSYHLKLQTLMREVKEAHTKMFPGGLEEVVSEKSSVEDVVDKGNDSPPSCPTPDYDTMSLKSNKTPREFVEMNSIKSFNTSSAAIIKPKPPPVYFPPPGFQDEVEKSPPVSSTITHTPQRNSKSPPTHHQSSIVTVREYPTKSEQKAPSKLKFLTNKPNCVRFGDELSQTLSQVSADQKEGSAATSAPHHSHNHAHPPKKNTNVVTISIQHPVQNPFFLHSTKKGPAPQPPTKNKVTFNF